MSEMNIELEETEEVEDPTGEVEETEEAEEWVPPTREEFEALQDALKKSNNQAKHFRLKAKEVTVQPDEDAETKIRSEVEAKWRPRVFKTAASAALSEAGATNSERLLKLLDLSELDLDDETGDVIGLDEQIEDLKTTYPELFTAKRRNSIPNGGVKGKAPARKLSVSEQQAQALGLSI